MIVVNYVDYEVAMPLVYYSIGITILHFMVSLIYEKKRYHDISFAWKIPFNSHSS